MALLRILVDGYSLLHAWPEMAAGEPRHSSFARNELLKTLTHYQDSLGTPITVFFDGGGAPKNTPDEHSSPEMEVIYSKAGKTADDLIERVASRLAELGEVIVVTNDYAERNTVVSFGAMAQSCEEFIHAVNAALQGLTKAVKSHNQREQRRFKNSG